MERRFAAALALAVVLLAGNLPRLGGEENSLRLGVGVEGNLNTDYGLALGRSIMVDFRYFKRIVPGAAVFISDDFTAFSAVEPELFARWYALPFWFKNGGLFVQADMGVSFTVERGGAFRPRFLGGLTGGFRLPFLGEDYYVEPYVRTGYPFIGAFGIRLGCRF